jgi:hypothetical protein
MLMVDNPFRNVIDVECFVAYIKGEQLEALRKMMPLLKWLHIVINVHDTPHLDYYHHLSMLMHLDNLGLWFMKLDWLPCPPTPRNLASNLQSLVIGWNNMHRDFMDGELIFCYDRTLTEKCRGMGVQAHRMQSRGIVEWMPKGA